MDKEKMECLKDLKECCKEEHSNHRCNCHHGGGGSSCAVYGIGLIGAFIYYYPQCVVFTDYLMAILKSFAWPALLIFKAYTMLQM